MLRRINKSLILTIALVAVSQITAYAEPVVEGQEANSVAPISRGMVGPVSRGIVEPVTDLENTPTLPTYNNMAERIAKKQEIDAAVAEVQMLDSEITNNTIEIQKNTDRINELNEEIQRTQEEIEEVKEEMKEDLKVSGKRIRALSQTTPQLEMVAGLIESKSLTEVISKASMIVKVINFDNKTFKKATENRNELESLEAKQDKEKKIASELLEKCNEASDKLLEKKANLVDKLEKLKEEYGASNNSFLGYQSSDAIELQAKLKEAYKTYVFTPLENQAEYIETIKTNPGIYGIPKLDTNLKFTQEDIIMYATSLLDIPYVWGGTTVNGFDCSGFVQYVYSHYGVYLPRVSEDQQNVGIDIENPMDLQAGDLLFYGDPAHHVTMYIQPGLMIEAPRTGDVVKVSAIRPYTRARRVVDWTKVSIGEE